MSSAARASRREAPTTPPPGRGSRGCWELRLRDDVTDVVIL
jgi:hypothetical protein